MVIEERLRGEEASVLAVTDGEAYVDAAAGQDHKQIFDKDRGPNTGGMGSYSPAPLVDKRDPAAGRGDRAQAAAQGPREGGPGLPRA